MWKNSLNNVESDNNKILYETQPDFLQQNGTYFLNKPRRSGVICFIFWRLGVWVKGVPSPVGQDCL